jgi:hypothetical protein
MFMRSGGTESLVLVHVSVVSIVVLPVGGLSGAAFKFGEFHTIGLSVAAFKFGEYRAANAVCINAIQSSTPTNMGTALITLFLLMFSTPFGWYHILNSVI